jgi:hypothetical protein
MDLRRNSVGVGNSQARLLCFVRTLSPDWATHLRGTFRNVDLYSLLKKEFATSSMA